MTERLYYSDAYLREFDATVRSVDEREGRVLVTLDRSAFYPTSGGQPFDTGALGGLRVIDVVDEEDGSVVHVVEGPPPRAGATIHGVIDWARRFDHMQQHTGQHVLSAAFDRLFGVRTVSFHLGAAASTIDLAREMTPAEIARAEAEANRVVWEDRLVSIRYADAADAARLPLRKEPVRGGVLRLVDVDSWDLSACGGTHVARTGAIGNISVASWERFKGGQRLEFLCGGRALARFGVLRDAVAASVRLLSVLPEELPGAIERLQGEAKEQKRALSAAQVELARYRAADFAVGAAKVRLRPEAGGAGISEIGLVLRVVDADANALKTLAAAIVERGPFVVVLAAPSAPSVVVVACSAGLPVAASGVLSALTARFGGRGGGRPELAQGGGLTASGDAILAAARETLSSSIQF